MGGGRGTPRWQSAYADDEDWAEPVLLDSAVLRTARKDPTAGGAELLKKVFE